MNYRSLWAVAAPALIASALVGCTKPSVVGKWEGSVLVPGQPTTGTTTLDLRPDGTITQFIKGVGSFAIDGTYKIDGDKMTINVTGMKANGAPVPPAVIARMPKNVFNITSRYKLDGDALTITELDPATGSETARTMTMKRAKDAAN